MPIWDVVKVEDCFTNNMFPFSTAESSAKPPQAGGIRHSGPLHTGKLQHFQSLSCDFDCCALPGRCHAGAEGLWALGLGSWEVVGAGNSRERTELHLLPRFSGEPSSAELWVLQHQPAQGCSDQPPTSTHSTAQHPPITSRTVIVN